MPLVAAKCTSCGAVLKVNSDLDAAVCDYCRTPFIIEKAINNYTVNNQISISNSDVHIHNGPSIDEKLNNAETFLDLGNADKAEELYREVIDEAPGDYRGWWGFLLLKTDKLTALRSIDEDIQTLAESAIKVASPDIKPNLKSSWDMYSKTIDEYTTSSSSLSHNRREQAEYLASLKKDVANLPNNHKGISFFAIGICIIVLIIVLVAYTAREITVRTVILTIAVSGLFGSKPLAFGFITLNRFKKHKKELFEEIQNVESEINRLDSEAEDITKTTRESLKPSAE